MTSWTASLLRQAALNSESIEELRAVLIELIDAIDSEGENRCRCD